MFYQIAVIAILFSAVYGSPDDHTLIGFGASRLKAKKTGAPLKASATATTSCDNIKQYWFSQAVVDNFAPKSAQKLWAGQGQRYWLNREFWGGEGFPIFVFIGGEGEESCTRLTDHMYLYDLAQQHKALLVDVEHRFYGESYPTEDMSTKNLQYLSAEQALADLARVIGYIKSELKTEKSTVLTIGGSYPGNLAAWFREKYPSVTHGSIASSAPVTAKTNFYEYMEVVGQSIVYYSGQDCYDAIESAANTVAKLASGNADNVKKLENDFKTCSAIESKLDMAVLMSDLMGNIQGTVQYNREHNGVMNISNICHTMLDGKDPYTQFVALQAQYREANQQTCEDASWTDTKNYLAAPQKDPSNAARPWTYQTCNEFGYYQTADSPHQPFHSWTWLNLDFSNAICKAAFDITVPPETEWINQAFGATHLDTSNTVFPSGTIDPWHALGVTNTTHLAGYPSDQSVFIEGTAHCNDLYAPASSDSSQLTQARQKIAGFVANLLQK